MGFRTITAFLLLFLPVFEDFLLDCVLPKACSVHIIISKHKEISAESPGYGFADSGV